MTTNEAIERLFKECCVADTTLQIVQARAARILEEYAEPTLYDRALAIAEWHLDREGIHRVTNPNRRAEKAADFAEQLTWFFGIEDKSDPESGPYGEVYAACQQAVEVVMAKYFLHPENH